MYNMLVQTKQKLSAFSQALIMFILPNHATHISTVLIKCLVYTCCLYFAYIV